MSSILQVCLIILILITILVVGILRFNKLDLGSKILCILIAVCILNESISYYCAVKYHTNLLVYNIYDLVEFFLVCLYFNSTIDIFIKKKIGLFLGIIGLVVGLLTMYSIQPTKQINTYFIFFEGFCITGMSLYAFYKILLNNEQLQLTLYPHFWFTATLLMYWNISLANWGTYDLLRVKFPGIIGFLNSFIWSLDILCYMAFGTIFYLYPKMQAKDE
jgi:hypothetical protein